MKIYALLRPALLTTGLAGGLLSAACSYEVGEEVVPCTENVSAVTYRADIKPILEQNCYTCHSEKNNDVKGGYNNWEDFGALQRKALSGRLVKVLEHKDEDFKTLYMPRDGAKLSACDIERIKAWVKAGAPQ